MSRNASVDHARTLLLGLDGATFRVLEPLMAAGHMPNLAALAAESATAALTTVVPALTPPAWTSLVTGRSPGQHGIFDFFLRDEARPNTLRFATAHDILTPDNIWTLANRGGLRSIALNFPVTFPPLPIDGYLVAGWMPRRQLRFGCHPETLYPQLKALPDFDVRVLAMDMRDERQSLEGDDPATYAAWIDAHIEREWAWFAVLKHLLNSDPTCRLLSVVLDGVDKLQHRFWPYLEPEAELDAAGQAVRDKCLSYFRELDQIIVACRELLTLQDTLVIASDHGFGPQRRTFFVNAWLRQQGYLAWTDEAQVPQHNAAETLGVGHIARHTYLLDWQRTRVYAALPSGNGLYIVRADDEHPGGVPDHQYEAFREQLIDELLALRVPGTDTPIVTRVWKREAVFAGPRLEMAPDLTLVLADHGLISILEAETWVLPRPSPLGTHHPAGVLLAHGPHIVPGRQPAPLSILDVAPLILYSLDLPVPAELEGRLPDELIRPESLAAQPPRFSGSAAGSAPDLPQALNQLTPDPEAQARIVAHLRGLGYLE